MIIERTSISELAIITMGQSPSGKTYNNIGDGLPLLNGPTEFGITNPNCTLFTTDSKRESQQGDLIFCVRGSTTGRMNWADQIYSLGRGVCSIRGNNLIETRYIKYCIDLYLEELLQIAGGGTFPNLSKNDIGSLKIPNTRNNEKIASILSTYDDLIENNLKRIKLLEEMAQLHYKELMIELLNTKSKQEEFVKDCLEFYIGGGWGQEEYKEGFPEPAYVIRGTDIPNSRVGNITGIPLRYHKTSNLSSRKLQAGDIVFEISNGQINNIGRTVLFTQKLSNQFNEPVMCASFAKLIRVNNNVSPEFFYLFLNEGQQNGLLYQYKSNSANGINNFAFETFIEEVKITLPNKNEMKLFTDKVAPIFSLISNLGEQNTKLREAKDILLPRLISGEIEV